MTTQTILRALRHAGRRSDVLYRLDVPPWKLYRTLDKYAPFIALAYRVHLTRVHARQRSLARNAHRLYSNEITRELQAIQTLQTRYLVNAGRRIEQKGLTP